MQVNNSFVVIVGLLALVPDKSAGINHIHSGNTARIAPARFYTTVIQPNGVSRRIFRLSGNRLQSAATTNTVTRFRGEGDFSPFHPPKAKKIPQILDKKPGGTSAVKHRFKQIQVQPSDIEKELAFDFSDFKGGINASPIKPVLPIERKSPTIKPAVPFNIKTTPLNIQKKHSIKANLFSSGSKHKSVYCRRCYKFWRTVNPELSIKSIKDQCCAKTFVIRA